MMERKGGKGQGGREGGIKGDEEGKGEVVTYHAPGPGPLAR